jgi:ABC-type transport system involved in multi-copper enzyme maturation permease subunit
VIERVLVVARGTFRESVRDRVLLVVLLFAVALVLFSRALGWISVEDELKMVQDFSLSGISLQSLFLCMLVGAGSLAREMERRTVYTVLTRSCGRTEFILGKFVGLVLVCSARRPRWRCGCSRGAARSAARSARRSWGCSRRPWC